MSLTKSIYQLRELVTEQDPLRRMRAFLDWERRWVKTLYVKAYVDRPMLMAAPESAQAAVHKSAEERALRQMADELAKVAERRELPPPDVNTDSVMYSVVVLTDRAPTEPRITWPSGPKDGERAPAPSSPEEEKP